MAAIGKEKSVDQLKIAFNLVDVDKNGLISGLFYSKWFTFKFYVKFEKKNNPILEGELKEVLARDLPLSDEDVSAVFKIPC